MCIRDRYQTISFAQGFARVVEALHEAGVVDRHDDITNLFKEVNIKRSQMLLNIYYKSDGSPCGVSLSEFTRWGIGDNYRNRKRIRDEVSQPFEYYGLWSVYRDDTGQASFTAGPLLVLFSDLVLENLNYDLEGAQ